MRNHGRTILLWAFIALLVLMAFVVAGNQEQRPSIQLPYSVLLEKIDQNEVESLTIQGEEIRGVLKDGTPLEANGPDPAAQEFFLRSLAETDIDYNYEPEPEQSWFVVLLLNSLPILLILLFFIFMMRQLQSGGGKAMSFGKSKAKLLSETGRRMTFEDVAGADEAKEELEEIIHFLKDPRKFTRLGGRIPKGFF